MNDKKNLDRLFQEKFKDFEVEPNEQAWKNIELALKGKQEKKRVIPFWYRLSGVAAALLIGGFIANTLLDSDETPQNTIVFDQNQPGKIENSNGVDTGTDSKNNLDNERSSEENQSGTTENPSIPSKKNTFENDGENLVSSDKKSSESVTKQTLRQNNPQNAVALQPDKKSKKKGHKNSGTTIGSENAIAFKTKKSERTRIRANASGNTIKNETETGIAASDKETKNPIPSKTAEYILKNPETSITNYQNEQRNNSQNATNPLVIQSKKSVAENVAEKKLDSAAIATVEPNALEELLKENEKEKNVIAETKLNRWQITPQIAPIYFSSVKNGSPIDQRFSANDKTYDSNTSYGVAVNYAISKKFNVRTGINKLNLGYETQDVIFSAGIGSQSFQNISTEGNSVVVQVLSADITSGLLPFESSLQGIKAGSISQKMGYIEVPMEVSYKLVDTKFGINLIGGLSTLFLNENEVSISATGVNASLGKANNLNDVHFSSNLGIGFRYSFWKSFDFNFEPTFKYQINTFSRGEGSFKPYFVGLYSGISFKF